MNDGYSLLKCLIKHDVAGHNLTMDLFNFMTTQKKYPVKPRFTFRKKYVNVEGNEMVQVFDLSASEDIANTTQSYYKYS